MCFQDREHKKIQDNWVKISVFFKSSFFRFKKGGDGMSKVKPSALLSTGEGRSTFVQEFQPLAAVG